MFVRIARGASCGAKAALKAWAAAGPSCLVLAKDAMAAKLVVSKTFSRTQTRKVKWHRLAVSSWACAACVFARGRGWTTTLTLSRIPSRIPRTSAKKRCRDSPFEIRSSREKGDSSASYPDRRASDRK